MFIVCSEQVQGRFRAGSEQVQSRFRAGSEQVQSRYRAGSEQVQSMFWVCFLSSSSASSVSVFGIFFTASASTGLSDYFLFFESMSKVREEVFNFWGGLIV